MSASHTFICVHLGNTFGSLSRWWPVATSVIRACEIRRQAPQMPSRAEPSRLTRNLAKGGVDAYGCCLEFFLCPRRQDSAKPEASGVAAICRGEMADQSHA